ncbi:uncharacterized protein LOC130647124 [Hydractinia symbiolongicarpus]|uniref:uncharacterized protein LOC130647124 n=1 Tax=Hydractinia symbiolongicarpus TaxID=13093 RepID=UPI0025514E38|nr:uncharacterized protein LOC130647124 [Hydractinia symbiolongicarpus]
MHLCHILCLYIMNEENESRSKKSLPALSTAAKLKKLTIDRFVLAHFFLLFFVSFVIGVLFLHSTITIWEFQTNEEALLSTLESATHNFDWSRVKANTNTLSVTLSKNETFNMAVR